MLKKIQEIKDSLPLQFKDTPHFAHHIITKIDEFEEEHRKIVASDALAGMKPDPTEERVLRETLQAVRRIIMIELKDTVDDMLHLGDKYHEVKHKDGIR
jgi:hypothetical protein